MRDHAAQAQRAVDRSPHKVDHLGSFQMVSGLMHVCMNKMQNIGKNAWGDSGDTIGFKTFYDILPNRSGINTTKINFYGWLRFMDAVLCSLIMKAAMTDLRITATMALDTHTLTSDNLVALCGRLVDSFLLPPIDRLEAEGKKPVEGHTESGHAVLLIHDLMTVRKM
jgi:hypothetical protein